MDERLEGSASTNGAFGMRVFDAGEFHVGFGIVVPSDDEMTDCTVKSMTRNGRAPFRNSLAVTLYGDSLRCSAPLSSGAENAFTALLTGLVESGPSSRRPVGAGPRLPRGRARKRQ
jgi:hypothetical protein